MTPQLATYEDNRTILEIESDIRKTRGRMDSTLDELGSRLTARSLMNSAMDWWESPDEGNQGSSAVRKAAGTLASQVRRHPMPALLIGAGVAWLISESRQNEESTPNSVAHEGPPLPGNEDTNAKSSVGEWVGDKVVDAKDAAATMVDRAKEKSHQIGDKIHDAKGRLEERAHVALDHSKSAARHVAHDIKEGYHSAGRKFSIACEEYPLAVGVAFAGLGALAGLIIPRTRQEDEFMGEQSDHLIDESKEKATQLLEAGKEVGAKVLETVKEQAAEEGFTASGVGNTLSELKEKGSHLLQRAKEEAVHVAEEKGIRIPSGSSDQPQVKNAEGTSEASAIGPFPQPL